MKKIRGLSELKTAQGARLRSIPTTHRSAHLDRHILEQSRQKFERELALLEKKKGTTEKLLRETLRQIELLGRPPDEEGARMDGGPSSRAEGFQENTKKWKSMGIPY